MRVKRRRHFLSQDHQRLIELPFALEIDQDIVITQHQEVVSMVTIPCDDRFQSTVIVGLGCVRVEVSLEPLCSTQLILPLFKGAA